MVHFIIKSAAFKRTRVNVLCIRLFKRNYAEVQTEPEKILHPYKQIHPWKSVTEFSEDIFANILYNKGGVVAVNKPYGIRRASYEYPYGIPNAVNYSLEDAIQYISKQLGYPNLSIVRSPEMYMSGVAILAADSKVQHALEVSIIRANYLSNSYWIVTTGIPKESHGKHRLAMKLLTNPNYNGTKAVIINQWSERDEELRKIKLLKSEYKVLSSSILNLCSLIEVTLSTKKWHAVRLFASTFLYSPILGDNLCGSRIQKVGNTYVKVDPFLELANGRPKLDKKLFKLLNLSPAEQDIIPAHIHLKSVFLPHLFGETVRIEAPLMPPFDWTCKQLEFKCFMENT